MQKINYNVEWFYFLSKDKLNSLVNSDLYRKYHSDLSINVAKDTESLKKMFTIFPTPLLLFEFQNSVEVSRRNFYELIPGNTHQKIHFDIDIGQNLFTSFNEEEFINDLIETLQRLIKVELNLSKDVLIFTSHNETKKSYHIIIDNYCLKDCNETRKLIHLMIDQCPSLGSFIDKSIYTKNRQLRLFGSSKINSSRVKIFKSNWRYKKNEVNYCSTDEKEIFLNSLVSDTSHCSELNLFSVDHQVESKKQIQTFESQHSERDIMKLISLNFSGETFFEITNIIDNLIITKRTKPSFCELCNRIHEHENPFLVITKNNLLLYSCRRNDIIVVIGKFETEEDKLQLNHITVQREDELQILKDEFNSSLIKSKNRENAQNESFDSRLKKMVKENELINRLDQEVNKAKKIPKKREYYIERNNILRSLLND
jgi:hypothetical protein